MRKATKFYLHTIDGKAAGFDGEQICYATYGNRWAAPLCASLRQIRREQGASIRYRRRMKFDDGLHAHYGYRVVSLPEPSHD